jgi:hypothetical protein
LSTSLLSKKNSFLLSNTSTCQITSTFLSDIYNLRVDSAVSWKFFT